MNRDKNSVSAGTITEWNDERGFGWLEAEGERLFVHIKEFERGQRRPRAGEKVRFVRGVDPQGRSCAKSVVFVRSGGRAGIGDSLQLMILLVLPGLVFNHGRRLKFCPDNPAEDAMKPKLKETPIGIVTPAEARKVLSACCAEILPAMAIGLFAGVRDAELKRLDWAGVDIGGGFTSRWNGTWPNPLAVSPCGSTSSFLILLSESPSAASLGVAAMVLLRLDPGDTIPAV